MCTMSKPMETAYGGCVTCVPGGQSGSCAVFPLLKDRAIGIRFFISLAA